MQITATYSPEDNKMRLYPSARLDADTYAKVKAAGFLWAPKQELFVAPRWSVTREDLAIELAGEIQPEAMTMAERAEAKAARLDDLAERTIQKAGAYHNAAQRLSERFADGQPILRGHHSERKAQRDHDKAGAALKTANKLQETANYWLYKASGAIGNANYKNDPRVRAGRIKTLLAELRDYQRDINKAHENLVLFELAKTDNQIMHLLGRFDVCSSYDLYHAVNAGTVTPQDALQKCIKANQAVIESRHMARRIAHTLNRLAYEREFLGNVARYNGELTPVILQAFAREHGAEKPEAKKIGDVFTLESGVPLPLHLGTANMLELTPDNWRDLMQSVGYEVPEKVERRKSNKPDDAPLLNPTPEHAAQLQLIWNLRAELVMLKKRSPVKAVDLRAVDQAKYSANSKGDHAYFNTREISQDANIIRGQWRAQQFVKDAEPVFRLRVRSANDYYIADSVVLITDKLGKPLPLDLDALESAARADLAAFGEQVAA